MVTIYDNLNPGDHSPVSRLLVQMLVSGAVIVVLAGLLLTVFARARIAAIDVKKQVELNNLHIVLVTYYVGEGEVPINHSDEKRCVIGSFYDNKKCLRELSRDGYGSPPISPNDEPYYYYNDDEKFYVATRLKKELPESARCPHDTDPYLWCKSFEK